MDYVQGLSREEQEDLFRNFKKLSAALFETDEVVNVEGYDRDFNPVSYESLQKPDLPLSCLIMHRFQEIQSSRTIG